MQNLHSASSAPNTEVPSLTISDAENDWDWAIVPGALTCLGVGNDGTVWGVNGDGDIFRRDGEDWTRIPGGLSQISVGNAAHVWGVNGDGDIFRRDGNDWTRIPGGLSCVSVAPDGSVWGVNSAGNIFRRDGNDWTLIPGGLCQISVGSATQVWGVNSNGDIFQWVGHDWTRVPGGLSWVSVAADGTVWGVNSEGDIFLRAAGEWSRIPGGLSQIAVGRGDSVWGVNSDGNIFYRAYQERNRGLTEAELRAAIATYAPVVGFHPDERYHMCSIEAFLNHATLHDSRTGSDIRHPRIDQLPIGGAGDGSVWLVPEDDFKGGDLSTARAYVHALWRPGLAYTDLQFWLFYAYNGPGTAHVNGLVLDTIAHSGDADLAPLGEHYGDWECCMVRIDNHSKTMIGAWLSQHDAGQMFGRLDIHTLERVNGSQIKVYASRNGHALYAQPGSNYTERHKYPGTAIPAGIEFFLRNDTAAGGEILDCAARYDIIAADWLSASIPRAHWVDYPYRWGPEGTVTHMTPETVTNVISGALGWIGTALSPFLTHVVGNVVSYFVKDDVNGPGAPIGKSTWSGGY